MIAKLLKENENSPKSFMTIRVLTFATLSDHFFFLLIAWGFVTMYFICIAGEHSTKELIEFE